MQIRNTATVNAAIAAAQSLPGLIRNLEAVSPGLASQLEAKPLLASKSPWGTLAAGIVGAMAARYGFGFDDATTGLVAGLFTLLGGYAMRAITKQPTSGLVVVQPPAVADSTPIADKLG